MNLGFTVILIIILRTTINNENNPRIACKPDELAKVFSCIFTVPSVFIIRRQNLLVREKYKRPVSVIIYHFCFKV